MPQRASSLRRHVFYFALCIAGPLVIAGSLLAALYVLRAQNALRDEAITTVREVATSIDHELKRDILALKILSAAIDGDDQKSVERVYHEAKQITDAIPASIVALRRPNGETVFNAIFQPGTAQDKSSDRIPGVTEAEATSKRSYAISDVFVGGLTGKTYVAIVQPIIWENQVAYLLELGIPTELLSNIMRSQLREPQWLIGVTGNDDRMIARNWEPERYVGQRASDAFIQNTQGEEGTFEAATLEGVHVFNVYARSKLTGWRVGAGIPMNIFEAALYRSLLALAGIAIIALCCSTGLSYAYARIMLRPAEELRKLASAPAHERELPTRTGVREFDDVLGLLAKSLADLDDRDRHQRTLVNELSHRAKNTLTTFQAIAYQTHRRSKSWEEFRNKLEHRLLAMARSFDLLTKNEWRNSELKEVVLECCKPFCESDRIRLHGPTVRLPPNAVVGMGMVIHELATNATKYGAFSNAVGWVEASWEIQKSGNAGIIYFHWKEHDGPPVAESGERGFGSSLIASTIEHELHGKAETKLEADGFAFSASFPIESSGQMG